MKKRASKQFDTVLEKLLSELVKADKVLDNPPLLSLTMKTIRRLAEIQDYKGMYKSFIFPKANKYIADVKKVLRNSRYKSLIKDEFADVDEYRNDTVRLAIVGLYRKYESFRKALIRDYKEYHEKLDILHPQCPTENQIPQDIQSLSLDISSRIPSHWCHCFDR